MMLGGTEQAVAVCSDCINLGSDCGLELNRQAAWRPECNRNGVILFGGIELAVAVNCDCKELGLWLRGLIRSSELSPCWLVALYWQLL